MNTDLLFHRWLRIPYRLHVRNDERIGKPKVTIVLLHGLGESGEMWSTITRKLHLEDVRIVTLDLVGFGRSPKPKWATYSTPFQAKSVRFTLAKLFVGGKVIIVGHSLGALVAIETAKKYPFLAKALVLCSPPLYVAPDDRSLLRPERVLRKVFDAMADNSEQFVALSQFAAKYQIIVDRSFNVTHKNVDIFLNALRAAISNQTAMDDIVKLRIPTEIMHGVLDPLVINANLRKVAKQNPRIHLHDVAAGHEIMGLYENALVKVIQKTISQT